MAFQRLTAGVEPAEPWPYLAFCATATSATDRKAMHDRKYANPLFLVMQLQYQQGTGDE